MQRDDAYLEDIHNAAGRVARFIEGISREQFLQDEKTQSAVIRQIEVMGEAATRVSEEFRSAHPEVAWKELARLRNFYIHAYRGVQAEKVWQTARGLVHKTQQQVASLLPPVGEGE
jgi:uncharacterized protein with HEPN domain